MTIAAAITEAADYAAQSRAIHPNHGGEMYDSRQEADERHYRDEGLTTRLYPLHNYNDVS